MADAPRAQRPSRIIAGNIRKAVFLLALPVLCEQFLNFLVGYYDTYLSGRIDAQATEAVGLAAYFGWLASMLFAFVGVGTTALVARHWGAGEYHEANVVMNRSIALSALMGGAAYVAIYVGSPLAAGLLDLSDEARAVVVRYIRLDSIGHFFTSVALIGAAALRGAGHMRAPLGVLGLVSVLNMIVSGTLVFGLGPIPPIGINGILIGTVVARFGGGVLMLALLLHGFGGLRISRAELKFGGETARRIVRIGAPAALDGGVMWFGQFLFLMVVARVSGDLPESVTMAAHMVGIRVEAITYLPAVAWGAATATIVGQSLGAGVPERARQATREAVLQCGQLALVITVVFYAGAEWIFASMHRDPQVGVEGVPAFRLLSFFQIPLVASIICVQALRGAGDSRFPMWVTVFGVIGIRVPVAYLFGIVWDGGLEGAWVGMCADIVARAVVLGIRIRQREWLSVRV